MMDKQSQDSFGKALFVLGTGLWKDDFSYYDDLLKDHTVDVWKLC